MVAYYMIGGPYSILMGSNVRMDLFYGEWSLRRKAAVDAVTVFFLIFYLGVMLYGALGSIAYSLGYWGSEPLNFFAGLVSGSEEIGRLERSSTAWRPYLWPIKIIMLIGLFLMLLQALSELFKDISRPCRAHYTSGEGMNQEHIALFMFASMMLMLFSGQRVFGAIGAISAIAAIALWGTGGQDIPFSATLKLMKWYPLLTLPMFIFMGYVLSESRLADDLYRMFHVWFGKVSGGLAIGTIGLMVLVSAMNGLSVAGMAIWRYHSIAGIVAAWVRQSDGDWSYTGRFKSWYFGSTICCSGTLRYDRTTTCWPALAGWYHSWINDGNHVHYLYLDSMPHQSSARACA